MTDKTRLSYSARCVLGWLLVAVLLSEGCSTKKLPEHPTQPLSSYPYSEVKDGLAVAIQPLTNPQESEKYFGTDLLSSGIFAVFVSAENRGSPSTFILLKERFVLRAGQTDAHDVSGRGQIEPGAGTAAVAVTSVGFVVAPVLMFPALFVATKMLSNEEVVKHNFTVKELQAKTLSAGEETHGYVYFQLPQGHAGPGQWSVHLEAQDLSTKETKSFDFAFDWK